MSRLTRHTCEEAFRKLDDYLDRELSPDQMEMVHEHITVCAACAREFAFESSVLHSVRGKLRQIDLPPDLQAKILVGLEEAERERDASGGDTD